MPVDTEQQPKKADDSTTDKPKSNSDNSNERMRSEVSDPKNRQWWKLIAEKNAASLPQLAVDGAVDAPKSQPNSDAQKPDPPKLDAETVKRYALELHQAINRHNDGFIGIGGGNDPDNKKITDLLDSLTATDRKAIEEAYVNIDGNSDHRSLRTELKDRLGGDDFIKTEAILNRRDGRANDAGNLMVSLSAINDDRGDGERRVLETFATLNSVQEKQLEDDFKKDYGMTVDEALKKYDVSSDAMKAVGFLRKPADQRTAQDIEDFAHFAIDHKNLDYFGIALRGDTPAAKEAREKLSHDDEFKKQISEAFKVHKDGGTLGFIKNVVSDLPGGDLLVGGANLIEGLAKGDLDFDRLTEGTTIDKLRSAVSSKEVDSKLLQAMDILHDGHVSLATIAADNTGSIFGWFDNKKAIGNAADNATDGERQLFSKGYELAKNGGNPGADQDKNALNFYNSIHKAFEDAGSGNESAKWEDKLLNGKNGSIISSVAEGDGKNGRFAEVESLSKNDWEKLKDPTKGPAFRKEIEEYIGKFTDKDETDELLKLIDKKVGAASYEESQKINRSLFDVIEQNKGHDFLFFGTSYNGKNVTAAIAGLSADEASKYKNDTAFRTDVDKFVNDNLDGAEKIYAKRLLSQVAETGKPAEQGPVDKLLSDNINKVAAKDAIGDVEAVLKDDKLRQKLTGPEDSLTDEEKQIKKTIDGYIQSALLTKYGPAAAEGGVGVYEEPYLKTLYDTGRLTVEQKAELGLRTKDFFIDASTASPEERQKLYDSKLIKDDEKQLIDTLVKQGGKMDLADEIRSFVLNDGTDVEQFRDKLKALSPEQKQQLRDEYTQKYGAALDDDVLGRVNTAERNDFRTYLTATSVDGRQDYYDNLERALKSKSGFSPDGSEEVLDRSLTDQGAMLTDFQSRFEKLPPEKQEEANKYFTEALKDYQTSKQEFAEKLYQVAVIVGGIAVGVATGGVGLAALAAVAAVGAVGRIALKKAVEGNDYDLSLSNVLKDGAIGAVTAGFSVVGPETIGAFAGVGKIATERFVATAGEELVQQGIKKGGTEIVEKEVNNLIAHAVVRGEPISEQAISQVVDKVAVEGITPAQRAALESALKKSIEDGGKQVSEDAIKSTLAGTLRQAGVFGTVGGTANVAIEASVGIANGNLDISSLPKAFATGFAVGSTLSVGFEALSTGAAHFRTNGPEIPAGTSEHLDLNFTKSEDGAITVKAPEGKEIDLTVKVGDKTETIHVDSNGTKLPDGAENIGIKNTELSSPKVQAIDDASTVIAPRDSNNPIPAAPKLAELGPQPGTVNGGPVGFGTEAAATPLEFGRLSDTRIRVDGQDVPVHNGTIQVGRDTMTNLSDIRVSRNQGTLRWNEADHSFYFTDRSSNGTYVKQGDGFVRLPKNQEVKINPDQEIRLGAVNGPKLEFFNLNQTGPIPTVDRQIYINGEPSNFQNGTIELGRAHQTFSNDDLVSHLVSNNHGTIKIDEATGQYIYTDHSTNGSFIKHANGQIERVHNAQVHLNASDEIHLGFKDGPVVKVQDTPGRQLSDGSVLYSRAEGDWIAKQDGTRVLDDRAGARITINKEGQVVSADSAYGISTKFEYGANGQLQAVKYADGSEWSTADDTNWTIKNKGRAESTYSGKISVERDGAIRIEDSTGKATIRHADGSEEVHWPGRQIEYKNANPAIESQKLEALARYNFPDQGQANRFLNLMSDVEKRGLPPAELAETYRQVNRLLSATDGAKLGPIERARLSEQILYETAYPGSIDQGYNSTCNVTCLETRAFEADPASAARLITDVALTGKYVTPQGVTVDLERTGGLIPDAESLRTLQSRYAHGRFDDVKIDGSRTYAGQIFENTAVNIHYADVMSGTNLSRNGYVYQPGDVIQYRKQPVAPGAKGTGEQLVALRRTPDGSYETIPIQEAPGLYTSELGDIYNRIVPGKDANGAPINGTESGIIVGGPHYKGSTKVLSAGNKQELENILLNAQYNHKLPLVLEVDTRDPIFKAFQGAGGSGGAHVVTVEGVHWVPGPDGNPILKVDIFNQWGLRSNRVGENAIDASDLFRATLPRDAQGKLYPPPPPNLQPRPLPPPPVQVPQPLPATVASSPN